MLKPFLERYFEAPATDVEGTTGTETFTKVRPTENADSDVWNASHGTRTFTESREDADEDYPRPGGALGTSTGTRQGKEEPDEDVSSESWVPRIM